MSEHTEYRGFDIMVTHDEYPENPRSDSPLGTIAVFRSGGKNYGIHDTDTLAVDIIDDLEADKAVILPVYLYDHSVVRVSTSTFMNRAPHAEWDSGLIGVIYMTREDIRREFMCKLVTKKVREQVKRSLVACIEELDCYLRGDAWVFEVFNGEGESLEMFSGFGHDELMDDAVMFIDTRLAEANC